MFLYRISEVEQAKWLLEKGINGPSCYTCGRSSGILKMCCGRDNTKIPGKLTDFKCNDWERPFWLKEGEELI